MATAIRFVAGVDSDEPAPPTLSEASSPTLIMPLAEQAEATESGGFSGVHDVQKTVDHWFERETHQIETAADRLAAQWAQENLPTLTGVGEEILPPEEMLVTLCGELWQRWPERIQVKMQDAIDSTGADLAGRVGGARAALVEMKVARTQLRDSEEKIESIRREMAATQGPVRYTRYFSTYFTWFLTALLIAVEFIANQPVFRIIWPMQADVAAALSDQIQRAANSGWMSGIKIAAIETVSFFEASMLAFAVVVLLFVLAKALGTALRPIVALRARDYPFASRSIDSLHRQKYVLGAAALVGTVAVVGFLFLSRGSASRVVQKRVAAVELKVNGVQNYADSLKALGEIPGSDVVANLVRLREELSRLENELSFADTIEQNNTSILILNLSLVCFALVVGFMSDERDLSDTMGEHPDLPRLKEKCVKLTESLVRHGGEAREQLMQGQVSVGRMKSLLRSRPLATLEAKRERLKSIVPRWRTENARLRGLDPSSIASFRRVVLLELPEIPRSIPLVPPDTFADHEVELKAVSTSIFSVEREVETTMPATA